MPASLTAEYVALYRALETTEPRRRPLFRDPFAALFLTGSRARALRLASLPGLRGLVERYADWRAPGARSSAVGRTCFIDDVVRREAVRGVRQVVLLGAGYDCRAYRMPELAMATVYEVDRADTQVVKRSRLQAVGARPVGDLRHVEVDFSADDLRARLIAAGWAAARPSLFVWEGVTNYLDEESVARVLAMIGRTAEESALVFTFVHRGILDGSVHFEGADKLMATTRRLGEPWRFGLDPATLAADLGQFGLALEDSVGADDYRERYMSWAGSAPRGYGFYRAAVARRR